MVRKKSRSHEGGEAEEQQINAHYKEVNELAGELNTDLQNGLTSEQAEQQLLKFGKNKFDTEGGTTWIQILASHAFNFMNLVLLIAAGLAFATLSWIDAGVVIAIILLNIGVGFTQEYKSEKTMGALRKMSGSTCDVVRDGSKRKVNSEDLVPGDVISVTHGDNVPADARVFEVFDLQTDEALLTGESNPITKITTALPSDAEVPIGDRKNVLFMNSAVSKGKGRAIVFATGNNTEMGKIASTLLHSNKVRTPLQQRMEKLGYILSGLGLVCIGVVLLTGWAWRTFPIYRKGLITANSAAVAVIPQSIIMVTTLTLTVGVRTLANNNVLAKKLNAVETLGNITNICSDKTGTLTQGKMVATHLTLSYGETFTVTGEGLVPQGTVVDTKGELVDIDQKPTLRLAINVAALCNAASIAQKMTEGPEDIEGDPEWIGIGSPTEVALVVLGSKVGISRSMMSDQMRLEMEFPFDSTIKRMSTIFSDSEDNGRQIMFTKGAPERIMSVCDTYIDQYGKTVPLDEDQIVKLQGYNEEMSSEGLRVLALAFRHDLEQFNNNFDINDRDKIVQNLCFVGLVGVRDPPRTGIVDSIRICHEAGIVVHMVTGDHPITARAIAKQIGIIRPNVSQDEEDALVMTATEFDGLTEEELANLRVLPLVIARCSPESKVEMVKELQRRGNRVAMFGDGVNDSPAIKLADVGVAMGLNGSDVTKEAADLVLLDDNFNSVVEAVRQGRTIFMNIRRFIIYLLVGNMAEALTILLAIAFSLDPPLTSFQILWINLITSSPPAFVLGTLPPKNWYMNKYKKKPNEKFFNRETIIDIFFYGGLMSGLTIVSYVIARFGFMDDIVEGQGAAFCTITLLLMTQSYVCKELRGPFFRNGFLKQWKLHACLAFAVGTLFFSYYTPVFETQVFEHRRPGYRNWLVSLGAVVLFLALTEIYKLIKLPFRRRNRKRDIAELLNNDVYMMYSDVPVAKSAEHSPV